MVELHPVVEVEVVLYLVVEVVGVVEVEGHLEAGRGFGVPINTVEVEEGEEEEADCLFWLVKSEKVAWLQEEEMEDGHVMSRKTLHHLSGWPG